MKLNDIYHAKDGKVFKVVPNLARILNPANPTCIGCYFNSKEDQTTLDEADCVTALEESGIFEEGGWEYCEADIVLKEVTDEVILGRHSFHDEQPEIQSSS